MDFSANTISSGAFLALEAARRLPGTIRRLALYEPPASLDGEAIRRFAEYRTQLDELLAAGRRGDAVTLFMHLVGAGLADDESAGPQDAGAQLRQTPVWPLFEAIAPTLAYDAAAMGNSAVPGEQAAAVTIPLLALAGGASPAWMQQAARAIAEAAPQRRYGLLEGQTHDVVARCGTMGRQGTDAGARRWHKSTAMVYAKPIHGVLAAGWTLTADRCAVPSTVRSIGLSDVAFPPHSRD